MGCCVYGLRSSAKAFKYIYDYRTGKRVPMAEHYYLCHANDLDEPSPWDKTRRKYWREAKMRVAASEKRWEGRITAMPGLSWYDKLVDGSYISLWKSLTEDDYSGLNGAGIAHLVDCRDGTKEWVLMPLPKCRWCEDTGIVNHGLSIGYDASGGPARWEGGERCICEGGLAEAQERHRRYAAEQERVEQEQETARLAWKSFDSAGL